MITLFGNSQIGALVPVGWFSNAAPGSIAEIQYALRIWPSIDERVRPLVRMIVMFENGIDVVPFEQRRPVSPILFARTELAINPVESSHRRIRGHMIDNEHVRAVLSLL